MDELQKKLADKAVLPLWPDAGELFGLSRGATYEAAARGDIRTIQIGRLKKVPTAWLKAKLEIV
jgi:hypothetical protein